MKKRVAQIILVGLLLILGIAGTQTAQAATTVKVSLPTFPVTLNGQSTSNEHSKYPLLVYKDITYFPMTYYDARLMGLQTEWTARTGLAIAENDVPNYEYVRDVVDETNARTQTAQIAEGAIRVNGKLIDNSREPYPLLFFRDVTYFPLTWRFAVEEFGWQYSFDHTNGLVITNPNAAFETNEEWNGGSDFWGSIMGNGDLVLFFKLDPGMVYVLYGDGVPRPNFTLHNITGQDIELLPAAQPWEYQIYRLIGTNEELVYRRAFPFYSGPLSEQYYLYSYIEDTAWKNTITPGTYRLTVKHPEQFSYRVAGTAEVLYAPVESNDNAQQLSYLVTLE